MENEEKKDEILDEKQEEVLDPVEENTSSENSSIQNVEKIEVGAEEVKTGEVSAPKVDTTVIQEGNVEPVKDDLVNAAKEDVPNYDNFTSSNEPPEKKKKNVVVPIIIVLILLCSLGVGGVFFLKNMKSNKIETDKNKTKTEYRLSGNGLEDFDLYFMQLENNEKDKVYSPLSIKYALAMLQEGANGETKEQITNLIGDYKPKAYPNSDHMSFANAMFIRNTHEGKVSEDYKKKLQEKYNAEVILDTFARPDNVNNWVSNKTFNLVNNLLDDVSQNDFLLINALAIDMNWKNQIHCASGSEVPCLGKYGVYSVKYSHEKIPGEKDEYSKTSCPYVEEKDFPGITFNGKENVKTSEVFANFNRYDAVKEIGEDKIREEVGAAYREWLKSEEYKRNREGYNNYYGMTEDVDAYLDKFIEELNSNNGKEDYSTDFMLYNDDNVKAFAKDLQEYDGITLQYVGIMPKKENLNDYIKNNNSKAITKVISNLKEMKKENFKDGVVTIVHGNIPFFKYEYSLDLVKDLKSLGVENIFDKNKSDLSGIVEGEKHYIDPAIHKANIEFSNDGIKAAAATIVGGMGGLSEGFNYLFEVPVEEIDITFDKPYMYIIRDKATGEVWFAGTVYNPIEK